MSADGKMEEKPEYIWPTAAAEYELLYEIGSGAFATVYRARCLSKNNEEVAVKIMDLDELHINWDEIRKEIKFMKMVHHPNVVPIHCAFVEEEELWLVMPLLAAGSCAHIIRALFPNGIKDDVALATILLEVLKALAYIHKNGNIHRDIKAGNILLSESGEVKLADFGVAGQLLEHGDRMKNRKTFVGTPCWMAPEVMEQTNGYDYKADIWSLGITAMELAYGRAPYAHFQPMKVLLLTLQEDPPTCDIYRDYTHKFDKQFEKFVDVCLRKNSADRPTAEKLMDHKFFKLAKGPEYLVEKLLKHMPKLGDDTKPVPRQKTLRKTEATRKPISVGSWVFDVETIKKQAAESMELKQSEAAQQQAAPSEQLPTQSTPASGNDNTAPSTDNAAPVAVPTHQQQPSQQQISVTSENGAIRVQPMSPTQSLASAPPHNLHHDSHATHARSASQPTMSDIDVRKEGGVVVLERKSSMPNVLNPSDIQSPPGARSRQVGRFLLSEVNTQDPNAAANGGAAAGTNNAGPTVVVLHEAGGTPGANSAPSHQPQQHSQPNLPTHAATPSGNIPAPALVAPDGQSGSEERKGRFTVSDSK